MKLLLDTCTFLWIALDAPELSELARKLFRDPDNEVYLSTVSAWEIAVKHGLGRLALPAPPQTSVPALREAHLIESLPLREEETLHLHRLPALHRDPFDRLLISQAVSERLTLVTRDRIFDQYEVRTLKA